MTERPVPILVSLFQMAGELARRKLFIGGWTVGAATAMVVVVLLLPSRYTSTATLLAPSSGAGGLGAIKGLSGISDLLGMDLGGGENPEQVLAPLLESKALAKSMSLRFRLDSIWELTPVRDEDLVKGWNENFTFNFDQDGVLGIAFEDESPERARDVLDAVILWTDSAYRGVSQVQARRNLAFFDTRLTERKELLDDSEDSMIAFQKRTQSFMPSEQIKQAVVEVAKLEAQIEQLGIQVELERRMSGQNSSSVTRLETMRQQLQQRVRKYSSPVGARTAGRVVKDFGPALDDQIQYERLSRQILIHGTVYAFLNQQREQHALDLSRNTPLLVPVDAPSLPAKRSYPKRRTYVQAATMFAFLASSCFVLFSWWLGVHSKDPVAIAWKDLGTKIRRWS